MEYFWQAMAFIWLTLIGMFTAGQLSLMWAKRKARKENR